MFEESWLKTNNNHNHKNNINDIKDLSLKDLVGSSPIKDSKLAQVYSNYKFKVN